MIESSRYCSITFLNVFLMFTALLYNMYNLLSGEMQRYPALIS